MGDNQRVINVIRQAIEQETGSKVMLSPGVVDTASGYLCSAYIHTDNLVEDINVPAGMHLNAGDYIVVGQVESTAWVQRLLPQSMYAKMVFDANNSKVGFGDGSTGTYDFGSTGEAIVSDGAGGAQWGNPSAVVAHADTTGRTTDDHHAQSHAHNGSDGSGTVAHSSLTGVSSDDHHPKVHPFTGADHSASGLTVGHFLRATGTTSFDFQAVSSPYVWVYEQTDSPATWTKPSNLAYIMVECVGGGGGGGGTAATGSTEGASGAGGGGGGYARHIYAASELPSSCTATIGAGGSGGSAGANNGTDGGDSTFSGTGITSLIAEGGGGGTGGTSGTGNSVYDGGASGSASGPTGYVYARGGPGNNGQRVSMSGVSAATGLSVGQGGDSAMGGGGRQNAAGGAYTGSKWGGGGAGSWAHHSTSARAGGSGSDGAIIVTEFYV